MQMPSHLLLDTYCTPSACNHLLSSFHFLLTCSVVTPNFAHLAVQSCTHTSSHESTCNSTRAHLIAVPFFFINHASARSNFLGCSFTHRSVESFADPMYSPMRSHYLKDLFVAFFKGQLNQTKTGNCNVCATPRQSSRNLHQILLGRCVTICRCCHCVRCCIVSVLLSTVVDEHCCIASMLGISLLPDKHLDACTSHSKGGPPKGMYLMCFLT